MRHEKEVGLNKKWFCNMVMTKKFNAGIEWGSAATSIMLPSITLTSTALFQWFTVFHYRSMSKGSANKSHLILPSMSLAPSRAWCNAEQTLHPALFYRFLLWFPSS